MSLRIGIIGCGNISETYLQNAPLWRHITYVACADLDPAAAAGLAARHGLRPMGVEALLASPDIDAVLNLTIPTAHAAISLQALAAGKHVYTEKPLAVTLAEGRAMLAAAAASGRRLGSAPDTVLGPAQQAARAAHDAGRIGPVIGGLAAVLSAGMEDWHPNPGFFYRKGGGPVLDLGPYYLGALVNMLGPVAHVQASGRIGRPARRVTAPGPLEGQEVPVETFTTLNALLSFESGAEVTLLASWDVHNADLRPIELHGRDGTLRLPDPNNFGGTLAEATGSGPFTETDTAAAPFGADNRLWMGEFPYSCYRGLGLAEMAAAIAEDRPHRCDGGFGFHLLEVMLAIESAAETRQGQAITSRCPRPAPLSPAEAAALLAR